MTHKQLCQYKALKLEIKMLEDKLQAMAREVVKDTVKGSSREYPYIEQHRTIEGTAHDQVRARRERRLLAQKRQAEKLLQEIEEYIAGIDDSEMRQIIAMKHIDCKSWTSIGMKMGYSEAGVRKKYRKFMKEYEKYEFPDVK